MKDKVENVERFSFHNERYTTTDNNINFYSNSHDEYHTQTGVNTESFYFYLEYQRLLKIRLIGLLPYRYICGYLLEI